MRKLTIAAFVMLGFATPVLGLPVAKRAPFHSIAASKPAVARAWQDALKDTLETLERQSWEAWKKRDGSFFQDFLANDHVEVGFGGVTNKATVVAGVASPICVVQSYAVDRFQMTAFDSNTALLTYHAEQQTLCNGAAVPSPVWVSSLYLRRAGRWVNAAYQQTQTSK